MSYEETNSHAARLIPHVTHLELGGNKLLLEVCIYFPHIWQLNIIRALPCRQSVYTKSESHHSTDQTCQADGIYKIYNKRHLQTLKLVFGSVMRLALKSETGRIHANIWWDHWTFKNKKKVPLSLWWYLDCVAIVFWILVYQMTVGTSTQRRIPFFPHDHDMISTGVEICFSGLSCCSFLSLASLSCNAFPKKWPLCPDASLSPYRSHFCPFSEYPLNSILPSLTMSLQCRRESASSYLNTPADSAYLFSWHLQKYSMSWQ